MNYPVLIIGIVIIVVVAYDIFVSTLAPRGTGIFTEKAREYVWKIFYWVSGGNGTKRILNYAGLITICIWLFGWIMVYWIGNALLYIADPDSIISTATNASATAVEKFYFTGYVLSTMGLGDFVPSTNFWQIYTSIISFSGFVIITLAITYIVPVLSAEMGKRKTSLYINSLGNTPQDILINAWDGHTFKNLDDHIVRLSALVFEQSQIHIAYPILHNFHSHKKSEALYINLANLDEALTILIAYVDKEAWPTKQNVLLLRRAISNYLETIDDAFIKPKEEEVAKIMYHKLQDSGIPLNNDESTFNYIDADSLTLRRKMLLSMIRSDGWRWDDLYKSGNSKFYDLKAIKKQ